MLFRTFIGVCIFSLGLFTVTSLTGAKGPVFRTGSSSSTGGRSSGGYVPIWHGGK